MSTCLHINPHSIYSQKNISDFSKVSYACIVSTYKRVNFDELSEIIDEFDSRHTRNVIKLQILAAMPLQPTGMCQSKLSNDDF